MALLDRPDRQRLELRGVPETMLWPLWNRAAEARRARPLLDDPMAVELVERIAYDFPRRFGKPTVLHPIRARYGDELIIDFASRARGVASVVALGEGLETQLWRVGGRVRQWHSVDLPEAIAVRRRLLPAHPKAKLIACSALDLSWLDQIAERGRCFISAAGLLMYFQEAQVRQLFAGLAARCPGSELFFDTITPHVSDITRRGMRVTPDYTAPWMPWGITLDDLPDFLRSITGIDVISIRSYFDPYPDRTRLYRWLSQLPSLRRRFAGGLVHVRLG